MAMRRLWSVLAMCGAMWMLAGPVLGQDSFPQRPIRIVIPLPAGSGPDVRARLVADALAKVIGQTCVIENRPGGGGIIAVQAVLTAPPDGHTLLAAPSSVFTLLPTQKERLAFNPNADLVPLGLIMSEGMVIAVSPKLAVSNLAELVTLARREPERLIIGTNPAGSLPHMAARLLVARTKAPFTVLPYGSGGTNEAIRDIMGGRVHVVIEGSTALKGAVEAGELKALAIMTRERVATLPDLPTAAESIPDLSAIGWNVLSAARNVPRAVVERLSADLRTAMAGEELNKRIAEIGTPFRPLFGPELASFIDREQKLWWPIASQP